MHNYLVGGLSVTSQMELPGAICMPPGDRRPDVAVRFGAVPKTFAQSTASGPTWALKGERFLLRVPRLARLLFKGGREICVALEPGAMARDASAFVLETAFGILLHQRGALALHGAVIAKDGRAVAICGRSGAGKSTLAAALCGEGYEFVTDNICVVRPDAEGVPVVLSDGHSLRLWRESIERLDLGARQGQPVREGFEKYFIDPQSGIAAPSRLTAIYVLREARPPYEEGVEPLSLPDAVRALDAQAYRPGLCARMGSKPQMLAQAAALVGHVKIFLLTRPRGFRHLAQTAAILREQWGAPGQ